MKKQKGYEVDIEIGARCAFLAKNKMAAQARIRRRMRRLGAATHSGVAGRRD